MLPELLLPAVPGLHLEDVTVTEEIIILLMRTTQSTAPCPLCQLDSGRVHSHYTRVVADLPWADIPVQVILGVRRFFCDNQVCPRKIFVERLGTNIGVYARRTQRLTARLQKLALRLGGEAGARTVAEWEMAVSPATLIRLIRAVGVPEAGQPRVVGVDDWAKRKGQTYATLLVDLEQHRPLEVLPERTAETLAEWLKAHPEVEIISRDRSQIYAQGATEGAPQATQVADRFHLLQNMTDALKRMLDQNPKVLRETVKRATDQANPKTNAEAPTGADEVSGLVEPVAATSLETSPPTRPLSAAELRFAEVKALQQQGWSQRKITRHLKINRRTVSRYWNHTTYPEPVRGAQCVSTVLPYLDHLRHRWQEGCHNCKELFDDLKKQGYKGSYVSVWRAVNRFFAKDDKTGASAPPKPQINLSAHRAAWLLISPPDKLDPEQERLRQGLCEVSDPAAKAYQLAQSFATMIRERKVSTLDNWLKEATNSGIPELKRFATGLRRDYKAVKAALELPWSNGQTEGQINRLKLLKRQMYGRANFDLLRKRVLYAT